MEQKSGASTSSTRIDPLRPLVFLSYDSDDLCCANFVSHLDLALTRQGFSTSGRHYNAFESEQIKATVVVFSEGYTSSGQCMDVLVKIMELQRTNKHEVVTVYYELDPSKYAVRPNDYFAEASTNIGSHDNSLRWNTALRWASELPVWWDSTKFRDEVSLIDEVVWHIWNTFYPPTSYLCTRPSYEVFLSYRADDNNIGKSRFVPKLDFVEWRLFKWLSEVSSKEKHVDVIKSLIFALEVVKFGDDLFKALTSNGISVYSHSTVEGVSRKQNIRDIIREAQVFVIILSDGFAASRRCLDELTEITSWSRHDENLVIRVLYYSSLGLDTLDNLNQYFEVAFALHTEAGVDKHTVENWRDASEYLTSRLPDWSLGMKASVSFLRSMNLDRVDERIVQLTVRCILEKLGPRSEVTYVLLLEGVQEKKYRVNITKIESMMRMDLSNDVRIVGMLGEDGTGKTTMAKFLYGKIKTQFDKFDYIANFNRVKIDVLNHLRNKLLSRSSTAFSLGMGTPGLTFRNDSSLQQRKVLLVVDDVDDPTHIKEFIASRKKNFGPGSRILIASRNRAVIQNLQPDAVYEVERMDEKDSEAIFKSIFRGSNVEGYKSYYQNGNPLAIRILAFALNGKWPSEPNSAEKQMKEDPVSVQGVLRWSYEMLKEEEKKLFLDIACFFVDEKWDSATKILGHYHSSVLLNFRSLVHRYLLRVSEDDKIEMHNSVQEMAWKIVGEEFCTKPEKRSKLWNPETLNHLLMKLQKKWMMLGCSSSLYLMSL